MKFRFALMLLLTLSHHGLAQGTASAGLIEFHQLMARVIYLSASLENAFNAEDYEPESESRQADIKILLHEINVISGRAHKLFRE